MQAPSFRVNCRSSSSSAVASVAHRVSGDTLAVSSDIARRRRRAHPDRPGRCDRPDHGRPRRRGRAPAAPGSRSRGQSRSGPPLTLVHAAATAARYRCGSICCHARQPQSIRQPTWGHAERDRDWIDTGRTGDPMPFPDTRESLAIPHRQDNGARAAGSDVDADAPVVQDRSHRCGAHRCDGDPTRAVDIRLRTDSDASPKTPPGYIAEHRGTQALFLGA